MNENQMDDVARLAGAVSDGVAVDWNDERTRRPELAATFEGLRKLETIARACRDVETQVHVATEDTIPSPSTAPEADASEALPFEHWGSLRLIERLSGGGFGDIYRAHDSSLGIDVALKLWRPAEAVSEDDFISEARRLARVRHDNVLVVHGVARFQGCAGIWTDLLRGQTLESYLDREGPLGAREAALIGVDLCKALAAMHKAGIVHRDVKTLNVMREQGGRIVLVDFGTAADHVPGQALDESTTLRGTLVTMAPEQLRGQHAGPATDIYGLGVLLYRLVTRRYPVEGSNLYEIIGKHQSEGRVPLLDRRPDLPPMFVQVVERALASEPAHRYASAGAMQSALLSVLGTEGPVPQPLHPHRGLLSRFRPRRVQVAAAAGLVIVAGLVYVLIPKPPGTAPSEQAQESIAETPPPGSTEHALTANVSLFKAAPGGDEPLMPGATVHPGDGLSLEIQGSDEMYVYVLNEDEEGDVFVLFPLAGLDLANPLAPHSSHRLPGAVEGQLQNWKVTSSGGEETIIVIASRDPERGLERDIADFPKATSGQQVTYGRVSPQTLSTLRGIGGLQPGSQSKPAGRLSDVIGDLPAQPPSDRWVWQIQLSNP